MKTVVIFAVAVSLLLNATLAWLHFTAGDNVAPVGDFVPAAAAPVSSSAARAGPDFWTSLEGSDLPAKVKRLRESGFPPDVVRAIVAAQIREGFAARRKALIAASPEPPYWQNVPRDPALTAALREIDREEQRQVRELAGDPEPDDPLMRLGRERGVEFLPTAKAEEVRKIIRAYEERRNEIYSAGYTIADREKISALEKEQHAAIGRVLTPQELFEYDLRTSTTADMLREELSAFQPTEEEYRAIYPIRAAFDERFGVFVPALTPEKMRERNEASRLMATQIKGVLSPGRAAEYDRSTDYNYRRTSQLVARLELPPETTTQLYTVQKEFDQRRGELYRNATSPADRARINEQLRAMQQEAVARVTPLLGGARGVEAYKQFGGSWISNMVPRPPLTRPPAPPTLPTP